MTVTVASFRKAYTNFGDTAKFTDAEIQFQIDFGYQRHNADRWGTLLDNGVMLFAAHFLALQANAKTAQAAGQGVGGLLGILTSVSAKGVSWQRQAPPTRVQDGHWGTTVYGVQWREMCRAMGAGGLQIGVPSADDAAGGAGAWPGPYPSPW
jgi:hypothetical protein